MPNILLTGLPGTGKTTYLAALWHCLESDELSLPIYASELGEDVSYLSSIRDRWLNCRQMTHTGERKLHPTQFNLRHRESSAHYSLGVPDLSGELYSDLWRDRQCPSGLAAAINASDGIILFIHPREVHEPTPIIDAVRMAEEVTNATQLPANNAEPAENQTPQHSNTDQASWDAESSPTQVKLIDFFQHLRYDFMTDLPLPVAVLVSAWDLEQKDYSEPDRWLADRLPMLHQYLLASDHSLPSKVFGVSAQGGKLPDDREALANTTIPSDRISVVTDDGSSGTIASPLLWLFRTIPELNG